MGAILTCAINAIPVLLRLLRLVLLCSFHHTKQSAPLDFCGSGVSANAQTPWNQFPQSAEPCATPPTSLFMPLLMDPLAVRAQARFSRCSSVCGCIVRFVLRSGPECSCPNILEKSSQICSSTHISRSRSFSSRFLLVPLATSSKSRRQRLRQSKAHVWCPLMAPSRLSAQAVASRETLQRGRSVAEVRRRVRATPACLAL